MTSPTTSYPSKRDQRTPTGSDNEDEWELVEADYSPLSSPLSGSPVKVERRDVLALSASNMGPVPPSLQPASAASDSSASDEFVNVSDSDSWGVSSIGSMDSSASGAGSTSRLAAIVAARVPARRRAGALLPRLLRSRAGNLPKGSLPVGGSSLTALRPAAAAARAAAAKKTGLAKSGHPAAPAKKLGPKAGARWHGPQGARAGAASQRGQRSL